MARGARCASPLDSTQETFCRSRLMQHHIEASGHCLIRRHVLPAGEGYQPYAPAE